MNTENLIELEKARLDWSLKNFPNATHLSRLTKLKDEINEVVKELKHLDKFPEQYELEKLTMKYADCLTYLFDSAGRAGVEVVQIIEAFAEKWR